MARIKSSDRRRTIEWTCRDRTLSVGPRPLLMGILNVTPDSFSDGGRYFARGQAVERGLAMFADGADIVDVGGESTRPGADGVSEAEELDRVVPVVEELAKRSDAVLSIDTTKAGVARRAIDAGARIINDVSALTLDPGMIGVARDSGAGVVLMHMRGTPRTMQQEPVYGDVVAEVAAYLEGRIAALTAAGLRRSCLAVDPGIGFGKNLDHNLDLLAALPEFRRTGLPVVVGLSRKSFLGTITGRGVEARLPASLGGLVFCCLNGADIARVHDVRESADAVRTAMAIEERRKEPTRHVE